MGDSGCGKTSFLQAGLWAQLSDPDSSHRGIYIRFSDQDPLATIRKALADQLQLSPASTDKTFLPLLEQAVNVAAKPLVLLFDQFEQFFVHYTREPDRAPFIQALADWYRHPDPPPAKILVSIRSDLMHQLDDLHKALGYALGPQDVFRLKKFTPAEAAKVLGVIAETEQLAFDERFVTEIAQQELANREDGRISPVDLQILAWMIERQDADDLQAFNRVAFQKFGGVEGLLTRFLDRALAARVTPAQRQAAIKVMLALTDLDRQVRAGVLTLADLQTQLKGALAPNDVAEAVTWLARGDVRLITPNERASERTSEQNGATGYELAHERIIPALMRLAGKELTQADRANQYADWWEVLSEDGELLHRQVFEKSHEDEQTFENSNEKPLAIQPDQVVIIRAHMKEDEYTDKGGYTDQAQRGSIKKGFKSMRLSENFAAGLAKADPQPPVCKD